MTDAKVLEVKTIIDELMTEGGTWPEQEIVSAWLVKYGIVIPFKQQLELQEELTKLRHSTRIVYGRKV